MEMKKAIFTAISLGQIGIQLTVTGHSYYDTVAIKVISDHEIEEIDKKNETVITNTTTVSADGNTATFEFSDSSDTNADSVTNTKPSKRKKKVENQLPSTR
jgi:hypothetical protein